MIIDVADSNSVRSQPLMAWTPFSIATEIVVVILVTILLLQLKFSYVLPRLLLVLSRSFSFLLLKSQSPPGQETALQYEKYDRNFVCLDHESARRRTRSMFQTRILDILHICPDKDVTGVEISEKYIVNSRGLEIYTRRWIPKISKPKAAICFCHGYGDTCTYFFESVARRLASRGFAVYAMDYAGFGLSQGLHGYIPNFDLLVSDVTEYYSSIKDEEECKGLKFYLLGESMGGAVALKAHLSMPDAWDGAILIAPMCKIAEAMCPPWYIVEFLKLLARVIPKAKLVPSGDIAEIGFRHPEKREQAVQNFISYVGRPRLGTALSLLRVTYDIERHLSTVSLPLLILHGAADRVTDPAVSQALYMQAATPDKTLHLYENAWHAVLTGEPDETVDQGIEDIVSWLDAHAVNTM